MQGLRLLTESKKEHFIGNNRCYYILNDAYDKTRHKTDYTRGSANQNKPRSPAVFLFITN